MKLYGFPDSKSDRLLAHVRYWRDEHDSLQGALDDLDRASVGAEDRAELLLRKDFQHRVSDLLAWVADTLMLQGGELETKGIDAVIDLLRQRAAGLHRGPHPSGSRSRGREAFLRG